MNNKQLKIDKPCSEKLSKMTPNERGRFCDKCSKTVVDLTHKSAKEIFEIYKQSKGGLCGRVLPSQLDHPMVEVGLQHSLSLPYGKAAAGLMIAASILSVEELQAQSNRAHEQQTEIIGEADILEIEATTSETGNEKLPICPVKQIKGEVTDLESGRAIQNTRVSLVTIDKVYSTYTDKDGKYCLDLAAEVIDEQNIISFSFMEIVRKDDPEDLFGGFYYSTLKMIAQEEVNTPLDFKAKEEIPMTGGISAYPIGKEPVIYHNGRQVKMKQFYELNFDYSKGLNFHLGPEMAKALLGEKKGAYGARLYFDDELVLD